MRARVSFCVLRVSFCVLHLRAAINYTASVAQWIEHHSPKVGVVSSILIRGTFMCDFICAVYICATVLCSA